MTGRLVENKPAAYNRIDAPTVMEVLGPSRAGQFETVSFNLHAGELLKAAAGLKCERSRKPKGQEPNHLLRGHPCRFLPPPIVRGMEPRDMDPNSRHCEIARLSIQPTRL